jgi:hypothetical protein
MTTKTAGGQITGLLALTCEAQEATERGDAVHLVGDYEVELADGTKPVLGYVSVSNKRGRVSSVMGTSVGNAVVPGDVTVEAPGFFVREMELGATLAAGVEVGIGVGGANIVVAAGVNVATIGILLTGGDVGDMADVLWR